VVIPKTEGAHTVGEFQPISLFNGVFKVITKVLATRLLNKIDNLINPSNTAFIKGRPILDSVEFVQEIITTVPKTVGQDYYSN